MSLGTKRCECGHRKDITEIECSDCKKITDINRANRFKKKNPKLITLYVNKIKFPKCDLPWNGLDNK